jgi:putative acetyltransferase
MSIMQRPVEPEDFPVTREVVDAAFRPEDVVSFLDALRDAGCLLGEWLAADSSGVIAHIAFSRAHLEAPDGVLLPAAFLTPLAVRPDRQRRGVGLALMSHALEALETRGETLFFVLGHPGYYPKVGFRAAPADLVDSPWSGKAGFMMRSAAILRGRLVAPTVIAEAH